MTEKTGSWFQNILIPGDHSTYSELQNELDRREEHRLYIERCVPNAMFTLAVIQRGAKVFQYVLGRAPRTEVC
jgi:hypothetical protein